MTRYFKKLVIITGIMLFVVFSFISISTGNENELLMATTTSTDNTGLLEYLAPKCLKAKGIQLKWTATGTGKALKLGENCDVDVLMVHAPGAESEFVEKGFGIHRREIMYNDFIIIGPKSDPAGV